MHTKYVVYRVYLSLCACVIDQTRTFRYMNRELPNCFPC